MRRNRILCSLLISLFFLASSSRGAITIKVSDTSGSPVFNSLVTITNESDTTRTFHSLTDRNGICTINITGVGIYENVPQPYALGQNYPNPFNPATVIPFTLSRDGEVKLVIFNALGQNVRTLVNGRLSAGSHTAVWDGTDDNGFGAGSGIYIYELSSGRERHSKKMLLMDGHGGKAAASNPPRDGMLFKPAADTYAMKIIGLDIETYEKAGNALSDGAVYEYAVTRKTVVTDIALPGAGVSGTPVSDDQRKAAFNTITVKLNAIQTLPDSVHHKQLALFLAEQPEMEISGYGAGGAWGRFTDGRMVVFDGNVEAEDMAKITGAAMSKPADASIATGAARTAVASGSSWTDIPQTSHIGLYRSHEERSGWLTNIKLFVEQPVDENANRIYSYQVDDVSNNASVEAFMNLPGDLTVFALHAHGSDMAINRSLEYVYSVYTTTPVTPWNEIAYWNLLTTGQLVYYHPIKPANWTDIITYTDSFYHYAFTASFVENYWTKMRKFENARTFVYFNTCSAMSLKGRPIVDAIIRAGASLFAGWTYRSFGQSGPPTASYIFDRLLGSNLYPDTMDDPHRPFSWDTLKEEMISLGFGKYYDGKYGKDKTGDAQYSWLLFEPASGCPFKLLAPSIKYMDVDEKTGTDDQ
ncbi:MAG: FlgD immunoglobulin-like domain containing protein, partial [Candidatus Latescibacterota bacterium]